MKTVILRVPNSIDILGVWGTGTKGNTVWANQQIIEPSKKDEIILHTGLEKEEEQENED